jgi:hypothetical protein
MRRGKTKLIKLERKKGVGEITKNTKEIQGIIRNYFETLY